MKGRIRSRALDEQDFSQDPQLRRGGKLAQKDLDLIIRTWVKRLQLDRFRIHVIVDADDLEGGDASCKVSDDYEQATIRFARGWQRWTRLYANAVVVHELLHVHENGMGIAFEALEEVTDSTSAWKLIDARYNHEAEAFVDRLAWILIGLGGAV